jgi:hypothetical protein
MDVKSWFWRTPSNRKLIISKNIRDKILAWEFKWNSQKQYGYQKRLPTHIQILNLIW